MSKLDNAINEFVTEVLKLANEEIDRLTRELEATKHLLTVSEEVNAGYEKDCAVGFALQRDQAIATIEKAKKACSEGYNADYIHNILSEYELPFQEWADRNGFGMEPQLSFEFLDALITKALIILDLSKMLPLDGKLKEQKFYAI